MVDWLGWCLCTHWLYAHVGLVGYEWATFPSCARMRTLALAVLQLLDEGSPFLELSPLAGKDLYGERRVQHRRSTTS